MRGRGHLQICPKLNVFFYIFTAYIPCLSKIYTGCLDWAGAPDCFMDMLDKLQERVCMTIDSSVAASFELMVLWVLLW